LSDEQLAERRSGSYKACFDAMDFSRIANAWKVTMRWPADSLAGRCLNVLRYGTNAPRTETMQIKRLNQSTAILLR
jgi:hypothetical protein